jgi:hypothetical protein
MIRLLSLALTLILLLAGFAQAAEVSPGQKFLAHVDVDVANGTLSAEEGLMIKFYHVFDRDQVPAQYRVDDFAPLKCVTPLVSEFQTMRPTMSRVSVEQIDSYLTVEESRASYTSPSGHFLLTYYTIGGNAVPTQDVNPANGIPDFVEKIALYFDESWEIEVVENQFQAPPIGAGTYSISFVDQASYGYTTVVNYSTGLTRIVMHPNFQGFPPNDDPEGNVWGAAKVTAAHEFKHATQFATSRWSEGGWNEVDAVWAEDLVFDYVNDYYNYLPGDSPIRHPEISLDGGPTGTGSYEDCVWEIWMSETYGNQIITDYWEWRRNHTTQGVMYSWEAILGDYGISLADGWANFTTWNYGTGYRAVPGVGYEEAADYPYGNFVAYTTSYPFSHSGSVAHLAANFIRLMGFDGETVGTLDIQLDGADSGGPMTLGVHITKEDGTGAIETVTLDEYNDYYYSCQVPLQDIAWAGIIIGNSAQFGVNLSYDVSVFHTEGLPVPGIELNAESVDVELDAGETAVEYVAVSNPGDAGSTLNFDVEVWGNPPGDPASDKGIAGSTLTPNTTTYLPGTTFLVDFVVFNGGFDEEWLTDVTMDFPAGVTINSSTDFVGGSYGPLVSNNNLGDGFLVSWHGTTGVEEYGVIRENESAICTVSLTVDAEFSGALNIAGTIVGDNFGSGPHNVSQTITLFQGDSELAVTYPNGGDKLYAGDTETITWHTMGGIDFVDVAFSTNGGDIWDILAENLANTGSFSTEISDLGSIHGLVRISDSNSEAEDISDAEFSIITTVDWLTITPLSGSVDQGQSQNLTLDFVADAGSSGLNSAWLVISHDAVGDPVVLPVTMTVLGSLVPAGMPGVFALNSNYPNPFNPMTKISFSLPAAAHTSVEVLDVRGRVVRTLFVGTMGAGDQQLSWNGTDNDGQTVAAGLYLARLRTEGYEATVKMTLAK